MLGIWKDTRFDQHQLQAEHSTNIKTHTYLSENLKILLVNNLIIPLLNHWFSYKVCVL